MITVMLVDDHPFLRAGIRRGIESADLSVVGETGDGAAVVADVARLRPDVVVMDVSLPHHSGIDLARLLTKECPATKIIMFSMFDDRATIAASAAAGAVGYLVKDCSLDALVHAVRAVVDGVDLLAGDRRDTPARGCGTPGLLSDREVEVLQMVASGASTSEVAAALYLSGKTVKNHLAAIFDKLAVRDRTQAVVAGFRLGLVSLPAAHQPSERRRRSKEIGPRTY